MSTRIHATLLFNDKQVGKFVTVAAAWIHPRLQRGSWGDEVRVLIH